MLVHFFRVNRFFFIPYLLVLVVLGVLQWMYTQEQLMQWVNVRNSLLADQLFPYITYMGDGAFFVLVCLILLIYNWRIGLMCVASFALSSLTSEFLKKIVFTGSPRPLKFFEHSTFQYHIIKGLDIYSYNSFPSGHTTTAFAVFSLLAFLDKKKWRGVIFLLLGVLAGYSRVYLFQHFVEDTYAGSLVGTISSVIIYLLMYRWVMKNENIAGN
ncbi:phosphatase PAP2 family protein [Spirosoma sp. KCTC 42546]|uniref:phosphatase PAP2 family protein n=1 Tax=Spirosoma sp. KCTC 42546 TaxID=2520506 RepID=UPI001159496A|nr:phosphatase PAP2 family protein [Spirosoma sp. KCTC 42546]QDK82894.1 phosphatase PAP2 family protein [Spirosoma sp. KCTC 42546]